MKSHIQRLREKTGSWRSCVCRWEDNKSKVPSQKTASSLFNNARFFPLLPPAPLLDEGHKLKRSQSFPRASAQVHRIIITVLLLSSVVHTHVRPLLTETLAANLLRWKGIGPMTRRHSKLPHNLAIWNPRGGAVDIITGLCNTAVDNQSQDEECCIRQRYNSRPGAEHWTASMKRLLNSCYHSLEWPCVCVRSILSA